MQRGLAGPQPGAIDRSANVVRRSISEHGGPGAQRTMGNQARLRFLAGPSSEGAAASGFLQPKLKIGAIDDPLEREADRVADQVMGMATTAPVAETTTPRISRKCSACAKEDPSVLQAKAASTAGSGTSAGEAPSSVHEVIGASGRPLDTATRAFFEPRFGRDFSKVQVHTEGQASESASAIGARAYTAGNHLVFSRGEYAPHTVEGRRLLAHELTHVVQQANGDPALRRDPADPSLADTEVGAPQNSPAIETGKPIPITDRTGKTCENPVGLSNPLSESFEPTSAATFYSLPFHAPIGKSINIDLTAELSVPGNPEMSSIGFYVFQCCNWLDSKVSEEQEIGGVGARGNPAHMKRTVTLPEKCDKPTKSGNDNVYYLIMKITTRDTLYFSYSIT